MTLTNEITIFASRHNVPVEQAYVLPALFEKCAKEVGLPVRQFVSIATFENQELANYVKEVAATVATKMES